MWTCTVITHWFFAAVCMGGLFWLLLLLLPLIFKGAQVPVNRCSLAIIRIVRYSMDISEFLIPGFRCMLLFSLQFSLSLQWSQKHQPWSSKSASLEAPQLTYLSLKPCTKDTWFSPLLSILANLLV